MHLYSILLGREESSLCAGRRHTNWHLQIQAVIVKLPPLPRYPNLPILLLPVPTWGELAAHNLRTPLSMMGAGPVPC